MKLRAHIFDTRVGKVLAALDEAGALTHLHLMRDEEVAKATDQLRRGGFKEVEWSPSAGSAIKEQLLQYLDGRRQDFDIPLAPAGTDFQRAVWEAMLNIPYGETRSYSELANGIGRPRAVRAVGGASAANPIWVVIPCHRVIGSSGALTGYGGGLDTKRALLELEFRTAGRPLPSVLAPQTRRLF